MSTRSQLISDALYTKGNVGAVVGSGKLTGIYRSIAPEGTLKPYGVFFIQASEPVEYAFAYTTILEGDIWTFKVIADEESSTSTGPQKLAETLLATWISALGNTLTISGGTIAWMARFNDIPPYQEKVNDRWVFHRGTQLRIRSQ